MERYVNIEYECLLHLARIDRLHKRASSLPLKSIVQQLLQALQLCYWSSNDGQFIQTCYFELALAFLEQSRLPTAPMETSRKPSILKQQRPPPSTATLSVTTDPNRKQQGKQAASVAIRAATQMALNQKHRSVDRLVKLSHGEVCLSF